MSTDRLTELLWNHLRVGDPPTAAPQGVQSGGALRSVVPETIFFGPPEAVRHADAIETEATGGHPGDVVPVLDAAVRLDALPSAVGSPGPFGMAALGHHALQGAGANGWTGGASSSLPSGSAQHHSNAKLSVTAGSFDQDGADTMLAADAGPIAMTQVEGSWAQWIVSGSNAQSNSLVATQDDGPGHTVISDPDAGAMIESAASVVEALMAAPSDTITVTVVEGDARQMIVIDQFNTLADADQVIAAAFGYGAQTLSVMQEMSTGGNVATNLASIASNLGLGDVVFIAGNVFETNLIFQTNILLDADSTRFLLGAFGLDGVTLTLEGSQLAMTGGNAQTNEAWIVDVDAGGGLMILGGAYRECFVVEQTNILFDGDVTALLTSIIGGQWADAITLLGQMQAITGGNTQSNVAYLTQQDADAPPGAGDWLAFAERLANGTATADDLRAMAEATGEHLTVTYVDGSYEAFRIVVQFNLQLDQDTLRALIAPEAVGTQSDGVLSYDQFMDSGGNIAVNLAYVFDHNGGFDLQVILGDYVETNVIQQLNVMIDTDHVLGVTEAAASPYAAAPAPEIADQGGLGAANGTADMLKAACG